MTERKISAEQSDTPAAENQYYLRLSAKIRLFKYILLLFLVLFILLSISTFRNDITYENLSFLFRDMGIAGDAGYAADASISYASDGNTDMALFGSGLCIASEDGVGVYRPGASAAKKTIVAMSNPAIATSKKYMAVYDIGAAWFSIFSSMTKVYGEVLEYPIYDMSVSDSGGFSVLTQSREHPFSVLLYDKNFTLVTKINKEKYAVDIAISPDGTKTVVLAVSDSEGEYATEISAYIPKSESALYVKTMPGSFPLDIAWFDNNSYYVAFDDSVVFFDAEGNVNSAYTYDGASLSKIAADKSSLCLFLKANIIGGNYAALIFDKDGNVTDSYKCENAAKDVAVYGGCAALLCDTVVQKLCEGNMTATEISGGAERIFMYDKSTALVCYTTNAKTISLD